MNYKFCPKCGNPLKEITEDHHRRLQCTACGFIFYQNSKPCAGAIITDLDGKVLLGKRRVEPFKDWWDIPGGFLEAGEDPIEGARREVQEELGVDINIQGLLGMFVDIYGPTGDSTLNIFYLATISKGTPKASSDLVDFKWFAREDLPSNIAFKNGQEALAAWLKLDN